MKLSKLDNYFLEVIDEVPVPALKKELMKELKEKRGAIGVPDLERVCRYICEVVELDYEKDLTARQRVKLYKVLSAWSWHDIKYINEAIDEVIESFLW